MIKPLSRAEIRTHIFKLLFQIEFCPPEDIDDQVAAYFTLEEEMREADRQYIIEKSKAVVQHTPEIDGLLNEKTIGWKTSRMNKVDLAILRLAVYEIKYDPDVPERVAANEAVELAKAYSSDDGPAFVNGVLAKIIEK